MPVAAWLANQGEPQRRAAEAVLAFLRRRRSIVVEAVKVGILVKRDRTLIELRPKTRWLALSFITPAPIDSPRIARRIAVAGATAYFVNLRDEDDVDDELRGWLALSLS